MALSPGLNVENFENLIFYFSNQKGTVSTFLESNYFRALRETPIRIVYPVQNFLNMIPVGYEEPTRNIPQINTGRQTINKY